MRCTMLSDLPQTNANIIRGKISTENISFQHPKDSLWPHKNIAQCPNSLVNYTEMLLHAVNGLNMQTAEQQPDSILTYLWAPSSPGNTGTRGR